MTTPEDRGQSRLEHVMEVYDDPERPRENRYAGFSPRGIAIAGVVSTSLAVALLAGQYAVAILLFVLTLVGVGAVATDRIPDAPVRGLVR